MSQRVKLEFLGDTRTGAQLDAGTALRVCVMRDRAKDLALARHSQTT